jgi:23S rRNA pseudouridine1911/1915/1917 synthase
VPERSGERVYKIEVGREAGGLRLDKLLSQYPFIPSRSYAQNLIAKGKVIVDGNQATKDFRVKPGQIITIEIPPPVKLELEPEPMPLKILYEDEDIIVLSKPAGLIVHPVRGRTSGTLVNALLAHTKNLSNIGGVLRPGIVHRLDKDTSGLLVVAKNNQAHLVLSKALKERRIKRQYLALVHGIFEKSSGVIEVPVGRSFKYPHKMAVVGRAARQAVTEFQVVEQFDEAFSLLRVKLKTGRTHQIRVHMAFIRHPVVGDPTYGFRKTKASLGLKRQFLHAFKLEFNHPSSGAKLRFEEPLPDDLALVLKLLRESYSST